MTQEDKRPDPKPRKFPHLWQAYLWWDELARMKQRHILRISSIEKGKSNLDAQLERDMLEHMQLDALIAYAQKEMAAFGKTAGPIWDWLISIKGIGDHSAAKLLALLDDIGRFNTISKLWRFSGLAVLDGKAEPKDSQHYCRKLKALLVGEQGIADQFVRHHTFPYRDLYNECKAADRRKHPDVMCKQCGCKWEDCQQRKSHKRAYNDGHLDIRAKRKVAKVFLQHLWLIWRECEGLPLTQPYVQDILGHTNIVPPPNWSLKPEEA